MHLRRYTSAKIESTPGGVRTFPMLALSGAMLYLIEPKQALAFIAGLAALAIWLHAFLRKAPHRPNATSLMIPASNLIAYIIGPVALTQPPWVVVAVSVTAVLLLGTREKLHGLIKVIPQDELLTARKVPNSGWNYSATRSQPSGDGGDPSHALPRLVSGSCCLHAVLSELSVAKVLACTEHCVASRSSRRDLLVDSNNGCPCKATTGS